MSPLVLFRPYPRATRAFFRSTLKAGGGVGWPWEADDA
jgi:hypothetical protein